MFSYTISPTIIKGFSFIIHRQQDVILVQKQYFIVLNINTYFNIYIFNYIFIIAEVGANNKNNSKTTSNVETMVIDQVTDGHYIAKGNIK